MDAADILGAQPRGERPRPKSDKKVEDAGKGLKGLSREVFELTGGNSTLPSPTKDAAQALPNFKKRRRVGMQVQWEWTAFSNSGRTDGLELKHWQKKGVQWDDYPFAKFNKKLQLLIYNDEEYESLLSAADWSRKDTDALMTLVQRFDKNFTIIHDRWKRDDSQESLKDRYYFIQRKLTESRGITNEGDPENILLSKPYDRLYEEERIQQQEELYAGAKVALDKEELEILEKAKKIEATLKKRKAEALKKAGKGDNLGPKCAPGGVTLRSTIMLRGPERSNVTKLLEGIGMSINCASEKTAEAFQDLAKDLSVLLQMHSKLVAKRKQNKAKEKQNKPLSPKALEKKRKDPGEKEGKTPKDKGTEKPSKRARTDKA
mmetsp:Transcript_40648/g.63487  ORF Transcript_40648/g.63487 Transcript_40648/m.63487 type:complete len:375 (-) Transcript_40648:42-1166(-)